MLTTRIVSCFCLALVLSAVWAEDSFEPNNDLATAKVLTLGSHSLYAADADFFRLNGLAPGLLRVTLTEPDTGLANDLIVLVYNSGGAALAVAGSTTPTGQILLQVPAAGDYFVEVRNHGGGTNTYTLDLSRNYDAPGDDANEPNDAAATPKDLPLPVSGSTNTLSDPDWYRLTAPAGTYRLTSAHAGTTLTVETYNGAQQILGLLTAADATDQTINIATSQSYFVAFRAPDGVAYAGSSYAWSMSRIYGADDSFDIAAANGTQATASTLTLGTHSLVAMDDDWYRLAALQPGLLRINLTHPALGAARDLNIVLYNAAGADVAADARNDAPEELLYHVAETGDYFIKIFRTNGGDNTYDLTVARTYSAATDDADESNDWSSEPKALTAVPLNRPSRTLADPDWYSIPVVAGTYTGTVSCPGGSVTVNCYNQSMQLLRQNIISGSGTIQVSLPTDQTMLVSFSSPIGVPYAGTAYTWTFDRIRPTDDSSEPNNVAANAITLPLDTPTALVANDDDWFRLPGLQPGLVSILLDLDATEAERDLNLILHDPSGTPVASLTGTGDERLLYQALVVGDYKLRVLRTNGGDNTYTLTASRSFTAVTDDAEEPNDWSGQVTALPAGPQARPDRVLADPDWHSVSVVAGTYTINATCSTGAIKAVVYNQSMTLLSQATITGTGSVVVSLPTDQTIMVAMSATDGSAYSGQTYNWTLARINPTDDANEDNDTLATAKTIALDTTVALIANDDDWFRLPSLQPGLLTVLLDLVDTSAERDLNLTILGPAGTVVASLSGTGDERLLYQVLTPGDYTMRVFRTNGGDNAYSLTVSRTFAALGDDADEPNDHSGQPTVLAAGAQSRPSRTLSDPDWHSVAVVSGTYTITVNCPGGAVNIALFNQALTLLDQTTITSSGTRVVSLPTDQNLIVAFSAPIGSAYSGVSYSWDIARTSGADDAFEENDVRIGAPTLTLDTAHALVANDDDWFRLPALQPGLISFDMNVDVETPERDLNMTLHDATGTVVAAAPGVGDERLLHQILEAGDYYLRVFRTNGGDNTYVLTASRTYAATTDDADEPNDWSAAPTLLASLPATRTGRILADPDWYSATFASGTYDITVASPNGAVAVQVYDQNKALLSQNTIGASGTISISFNGAATRYVAVSAAVGSGYTGLAYDLTVARTALTEDSDEENDSLATAKNLPMGISSRVALDDDFFRVPGLSPGLLHVRMEHPNRGAARDLNVVVLDASGNVIGSDAQTNDVEEVFANINTAGDYFIKVFRTNGGDNTYTLLIERDHTAPVGVAEDADEPNDWSGQLTAIGSLPITKTGLRLNDPDWYSMPVQAGTYSVAVSCPGGQVRVEVYEQGVLLRYQSVIVGAGSLSATFSVDQTAYVAVMAVPGDRYTGRAYTLSIQRSSFADDADESNNSLATAKTIALGTHARVCLDDDFYKVPGLVPGLLRVTLTHPDTGSVEQDLNVVVLDASGAVIGADAKTNQTEQIFANIPETGDYFIKVFRTNGGDNTYTLDIARDHTVPGGVPEDADEPNDWSGQLTAMASIPFSRTGNRLNDPDWFSMPVESGTYNLNVSCPGGRVRMEIYDQGVLGRRNVVINGSGTQSISFGSTQTAYVAITAVPGDAYTGLSYDLSMSRNAIADDADEDNDSIATAKTITLGTINRICLDDDFFRLPNLAPGLLLVTLQHPDTGQVEQDLNVVVVDESGAVVGSDARTNATEVVFAHIVETGNYFIKVFRTNGGDNSYTLTVARDHQVPGGVTDDADEANDWSGQATALVGVPFTRTGNRLHDPDWYSLPVDAGTYRVTVSCPGGRVKLEVYDQGVVGRRQATITETGSQSISFNGNQTAFLAVTAATGDTYTGLTYSMTMERNVIADDADENNDTIPTAKTITFGSYARVCLDDDFYRIPGLKPGLLRVTLEHPDTGLLDTDLNAVVVDADGVVIGSNAKTNQTEVIFAHIVLPGDYFIKVFRTNGGDNTYTLSVAQGFTATTDDAQDAGGGDDTYLTAKTMVPGSTFSGICADEDWFTFSTPPGTLTATLTFAGDPTLVDLEAYDQNADRLTRALGTNGTIPGGKTIVVDLSKGGQLYFCVIGKAGTPYTLRIFQPTYRRIALPGGPATMGAITIQDLDGDGLKEILVGTRRSIDPVTLNEVKPGALVCLNHDGTIRWSQSFPAFAGPDPLTGKTYTSSTVSSRPVVADINGDGTLEVVVGVGAELDWLIPGNPFKVAYGPGDRGALFAVSASTGAILWGRVMRDVIGLPGPDGESLPSDGNGPPDGVFATPVVTDIDNDGIKEVGWGSWDQYAYLVDGRNGQDRAGWPINLHDTCWSSPLVVDVNGDGIREFFIGGDITANLDARIMATGGIFHAFNSRGQDIIPGFREFIGTSFFKGKYDAQTFDSSPIAADLTGDGLPEILIGSGVYHLSPVGNYIQIWNSDGSLYRKLTTRGRVFSTPMAADIDNDGQLEVVACTDEGRVHMWRRDGTPVFDVQTFPHEGQSSGTYHPIYSCPLAADLNGDGKLEIIYQQGANVVIIGPTGQVLFNPIRVGLFNRYARGTPAIGDIDNDGTLEIISGGSMDDGETGALYFYHPMDLVGNAANRKVRLMFRDDNDIPLSAIGQNRRQQVESLVTRFYQNVLQRAPETAGLAGWTNDLLDARIDGRSVAAAFVTSQEFINRATNNDEYVDTLYRAFFGREPDPGRNGWLAILATAPLGDAAKRLEVLNGFVSSQEFANLAGSFGVIPSHTQTQGIRRVFIEEFVKRFYLGCFEREADAGGLAAWTDALMMGTLLSSDVGIGFTSSPEFLNRNLNNADYIKVLYRSFFGRPADPAGLAGWELYLQTNTRGALLEGFIRSQEHINLANFYGILPFPMGGG